MAAVAEGVPGTFAVVAAGITGKETAIEGVGAETAIVELVLQFCVAKADGTLPETVRLSLQSGAALDDLVQTLEDHRIAPDARLQDPSLHVVLFMKPGVCRTVRYAVWLALGRLTRLPDVKIVPATDIAVERVDHDPVQGDGDILAKLPARITLAPAALALLMPS